jgi:hypothetical protein
MAVSLECAVQDPCLCLAGCVAVPFDEWHIGSDVTDVNLSSSVEDNVQVVHVEGVSKRRCVLEERLGNGNDTGAGGKCLFGVRELEGP